MSPSWFIAKRYMKAHRRVGFLSFISSIAIVGVALGTAALIITLSILDGFEGEIKKKVIGFSSHIQVQGYQNHPLSDYPRSIRRVKEEIPGIQAIAPFVAKEGMIRAKEAVDGIFLKGIDPSQSHVSAGELIVKGRFLSEDSNGTHELVIGKKLANRLDVDVGDKLVVFGLPEGISDQPHQKAMQFRLVGIYESGMAEYDDIYAYASLKDAQSLFQYGDQVSGYDILVSDITRVEDLASKVQMVLGYPHFARTVFQLYRNLFSWVELQKKLSPILLSLIIIVATVNIIGTLLMFVMEKTQAIGILMSLGASPRLIQRIFFLQGLAIALVGIVLGNALAFILCWLQLEFKIISIPSEIYYMTTVPVVIRPLNFLMVTFASFILCMVTSVLPSRAAAKLNPVSALRFG